MCQGVLEAFFRPEMLNRLDEVVVFRQLDKQSVQRIADLVLAETASQLSKQNIKLEVSPAVMAKVVEEGYDQVSSSVMLVGNLEQRAMVFLFCLPSCHGVLV